MVHVASYGRLRRQKVVCGKPEWGPIKDGLTSMIDYFICSGRVKRMGRFRSFQLLVSGMFQARASTVNQVGLKPCNYFVQLPL